MSDTLRFLPQAAPQYMRPYTDTTTGKVMYEDRPNITTAVACLAGLLGVSAIELLRLITNDNTEEVFHKVSDHDICFNCMGRAVEVLAFNGYLSGVHYVGGKVGCRTEPTWNRVHDYRQEVVECLSAGMFGLAYISTKPFDAEKPDYSVEGDSWVLLNRIVQGSEGVAFPSVEYSSPVNVHKTYRCTLPDFLQQVGGYNIIWVRPATAIAALYEKCEIAELFQ